MDHAPRHGRRHDSCGAARAGRSANGVLDAQPLFGGLGFTDDYRKQFCRDKAISEATAHHLATKFGTTSGEALALGRENAALLEPIVAEHPAIQAEVVYSVRKEMAATIEDVLARRLGIQLYSWRTAIEAAPVVGSLMAAELGWSDAATHTAITGYVEKIHHLLDAAGLPRKRSSATAD
jgi:glycerol-3-phosphate dehydrogenase